MSKSKMMPVHITAKKSQHLPPLPENYKQLHNPEPDSPDTCDLLRSESKFILMVNHSPKLIGSHQRLPKMDFQPFSLPDRRKSTEPKKLTVDVKTYNKLSTNIYNIEEKLISKTPDRLDVTFGLN